MILKFKEGKLQANLDSLEFSHLNRSVPFYILMIVKNLTVSETGLKNSNFFKKERKRDDLKMKRVFSISLNKFLMEIIIVCIYSTYQILKI